MSLTIRPLRPEDRAAWENLYAAYADFYRFPQDAAMRARVWGWLMDDGDSVAGLVAEGPDGLVGLAHFRPFARPLAASLGIYLDDLFTAPTARGQGVGTALIAAVQDAAREQGASLVRWMTRADNATARSVYDRVGRATDWVTYELDA